MGTLSDLCRSHLLSGVGERMCDGDGSGEAEEAETRQGGAAAGPVESGQVFNRGTFSAEVDRRRG
jgi:hypothetical protein